MHRALRQLVRQRAGGRCEYCALPMNAVPLLSFHVEHIIPRQHGGGDHISNLALACYHCNLHKGPNLSGIDPHTGRVVRLFHPRRQRWELHFQWNGTMLVGRTAAGRATIEVLAINRDDRVSIRSELIAEGFFPS